MTYMKFPRVGILKGQEIIEYGYLNQSMPQIHDNGSYVYETLGRSICYQKVNSYILNGNNG